MCDIFFVQILAFECIPSLAKEFRVAVPDCLEECPRMCKSRFKKTSMKGYPLEDIYAALGNTKVYACIIMDCKLGNLIII